MIEEVLGERKKVIEAFNELVQNAYTIAELGTIQDMKYQDQIEKINTVIDTLTSTIFITPILMIATLKMKKNK